MPTDALAVPRSEQANLPRVEPVQLVIRAEPFDDPAWVFEPKYDGFRALLYSSDQYCEIEVLGQMGQETQDLRSRVSDVLDSREVILDGQIVSLDRQGQPVLQHLLRGEGYLAFAASDLLWIDGADLRDQPLRVRKQQLVELLPEDTGPLYKVLSIEEHGRALFGAIKRLELSGIIARSQEDPYTPATIWYEVPNPGHSSPTEPWAKGVRQPHRHRNPARER